MRWPIRLQILLPFALLQSGGGRRADPHGRLGRDPAGRGGDRPAAPAGRPGPLSTLKVNYNDRMLEQLRGLLGAEVLLRDGGGRILASTLADPDKLVLPTPEAAAGLDLARLNDAPRVLIGTRSFLPVAIPVESSPPGNLLLLVPEDRWMAERRQAATPPLVVGAITLILVVGLSTWIASRFASRIRVMEAQVAQIANGDFMPVPVPTPDELPDLAASVNRMCESARQMSQQIRSTERAGLIAQLAGGLARQLRNAITGARMAIQLHARKCALWQRGEPAGRTAAAQPDRGAGERDPDAPPPRASAGSR